MLAAGSLRDPGAQSDDALAADLDALRHAWTSARRGSRWRRSSGVGEEIFGAADRAVRQRRERASRPRSTADSTPGVRARRSAGRPALPMIAPTRSSTARRGARIQPRAVARSPSAACGRYTPLDADYPRAAARPDPPTGGDPRPGRSGRAAARAQDSRRGRHAPADAGRPRAGGARSARGWSSAARPSCPAWRSASTARHTPPPSSATASTVGVIGAGHDNPGPRAHARLRDEIVATGGAVISEHHPDVHRDAGHVPAPQPDHRRAVATRRSSSRRRARAAR